MIEYGDFGIDAFKINRRRCNRVCDREEERNIYIFKDINRERKREKMRLVQILVNEWVSTNIPHLCSNADGEL